MKLSAKLAFVEAMRMSHMQARSLPAPTAGPLTAAMLGTSSFCSASGRRWMPVRYHWPISAGVTASVVKRFMSLTLPPEENTVPAPVRIITRTDGSALMRSTALTNSSTAALPVSALRTSGAFIVSVTTAPLCS